MKLRMKVLGMAALMSVALSSYATDTASVPMYLMGKGQLQKSVGTIVLTDSANDLRVQPNLKGLNPTLAAGPHMVLLSRGSCADALRSSLNSSAALAGNWPSIIVNAGGTAVAPVFFKNTTVKSAMNQVLVVRGGDNGQGNHILCGVVPSQAKQMLGNKS